MESDHLLLKDGTNPKSCMSKFCYGLGHVYNDLCAAIWFSYTLFYFQVVLQLEPTTAGALLMLGQVADAIATPVAGILVDRLGNPQIWHLTGTICVCIGFSLFFSITPNTNYWWSFIWYGCLIFLFQIGWATVQISHLSMIPIIARDHCHSSDLTTIRYTASVCCGIAVYVITWIALKTNQTSQEIVPEDAAKFRDIALIISFIGTISTIVFYCGTPRTSREYQDVSQTPIVDVQPSNPLKSLVVYQISLIYVASRLYTILNLIYIPLYLEERQLSLSMDKSGIRQTVASVPLVSFLASFIMSLFLKCATGLCRDKMIYFLGCILSLIACIWISLNNTTDTDLPVYAIASLIGMGSSATMVASLCLTADVVKTNGLKGGFVYSAVTFTDKLISGTIVLITQNLSCQSDLCPHFYRNVLAYVCGGAALTGLLSLGFLHYKR